MEEVDYTDAIFTTNRAQDSVGFVCYSLQMYTNDVAA